MGQILSWVTEEIVMIWILEERGSCTSVAHPFWVGIRLWTDLAFVQIAGDTSRDQYSGGPFLVPGIGW